MIENVTTSCFFSHIKLNLFMSNIYKMLTDSLHYEQLADVSSHSTSIVHSTSQQNLIQQLYEEDGNHPT